MLKAITDAGITTVCLDGEGDVRDICWVTCMEYHVKITDASDAPKLVVDGLDIRIELRTLEQ